MSGKGGVGKASVTSMLAVSMRRSGYSVAILDADITGPSTPQKLVSMIVSKAVKMAEMMHIPVLGVVENMAYFKCPDNDKEYNILGESYLEKIAEKHHMPVLAKIPIDPGISAVCDRGIVELFDGNWFESTVKIIEQESESDIH